MTDLCVFPQRERRQIPYDIEGADICSAAKVDVVHPQDQARADAHPIANGPPQVTEQSIL
jgi:hypothetical protein